MLRWDELEQQCHSCTKCQLCETRHNVVFGVGNKNADIMFIGEGPGEQEDLQCKSIIHTNKKVPQSFDCGIFIL